VLVSASRRFRRSGPDGPDRRRPGGALSPRQAVLSRTLGDALVVLLIVGWYVWSQNTAAYVAPNPLDVLGRMFEIVGDPGSRGDLIDSLGRLGLALAISIVVGVVLAVLAYELPVLEHLVGRRILPLLDAFPSYGWALLAVVWFGVGQGSVVFVEVVILLPFILINARAGLGNLDPEILEMARSFARSRWAVYRRVVVPALLPNLLAGVRIAYSVGWKVGLIAELFVATSGMGTLMNRYSQSFDSVGLYATIGVIIVLVISVENLLLAPLERRAARQ
jgi:NitT/TauT family transport system permease protein/sulfonate transport system permease protein